MAQQTFSFQAEVARLLHIVTHSLYSDKEIFLRELISNASDACDRLRYAALTEPALLAEAPQLEITIGIDKPGHKLTLGDNGIGMNREELIGNLGTIARSGTAAFLEELPRDANGAVNLIGQFGVGFYSAFMVADKVDVTSRKAGDAQGWRWTSDGSGNFAIDEAEDLPRGTAITLHLRQGEDEFLEPERIRRIVKKYSDHIAVPIKLAGSGEGEALNMASALWSRSKSEISAAQYNEFYRHVAHTLSDPWLTIHHKAEGRLEYTLLLFVPSEPPYDLFHPDRKHQVKLYVHRVFVTDQCEGLVPPYLRFLRGVVDSEDLPLAVSREMLQHNPVVTRIRHALAHRVLGELEKEAKDDPTAYAKFWENFGAVLKEGICEDTENRAALLKLARFRSTHSDDLVSLDDYVGRMKEGQTAIYTITGEDLSTLAKSPQIEGFRARGIEVLLLADPVDVFWLDMCPDYDGKPFKSATRGAAELAEIKVPKDDKPEAEAPIPESQIGTLIALLKQNLGDAVKNVRVSDRLTDSAVCLIADDGDLDMHLARLLQKNRQIDRSDRRILEINANHALIRRLAEEATKPGAVDRLQDAAQLLLDQARIIEGEPVADPVAFAHRLSTVMARGVGG